MLLDHGAAIRRIHEELALLRELLTGGPPPPRASLPASAAAALLTPSTGPFAVETAEKMLTQQVSAVAGCSTRPPGAPAGGSATRSAADSAPHTVAVPSGCSSPLKGGDHVSATSGGVAIAGGSARLPSATATTKGAQADAGSEGSHGGGRLRLRCRGMRPRLTRWLPTIVSIHCYVQGCAWCLSRRRRTPTLWRRW
jgi:hypothetical protein